MTTASTGSERSMPPEFDREVQRGDRFRFGENWAKFLQELNEDRIAAAERSLSAMLETRNLEGRRFIDVGSGSGLFSLAAYRLGAQVLSFDYDPQSVACTAELRDRFGSVQRWRVERGSVLDAEFLAGLGRHDIVYSWGVLHHTGDMWRALANVDGLVATGGQLFIAIYNDEGTQSKRWVAIKKLYNRLPRFIQPLYAAAVSAPAEFKSLVRSIVTGRLREYLSYSEHGGGGINVRGMSRWRDIVDWVGGYPFEVATPDAIFDFFRARGYVLQRLKCGGVGSGCNEFVFRRQPEDFPSGG